MNKTERMAVIGLFAVLIGWSILGPRLMSKPEQEVLQSPVTAETNQTDISVAPAEIVSGVADPGPVIERDGIEEIKTISNDVIRLSFSSWGGGIKSVALPAYSASVEQQENDPVIFTFRDQLALSYQGIPGISEQANFDLVYIEDGHGVELRAGRPDGIQLVRRAVLAADYQVEVYDRIVNNSDDAVVLRQPRMNMGEMQLMETGKSIRGMAYLGADLLRTTDQKVAHTGKQLKRFFGAGGGCAAVDTTGMPLVAEERFDGGMAWAAVKNKFFTQILEPTIPVQSVTVIASRRDTDAFEINRVAARLTLDDLVIEPGASLENRLRYYVGPKKYSILRSMGNRKAEVMEFGRFFKPVCQVLLPLLNGIERFIPGGYGIAIILLTILVKMLFWPVTHKGTESMKRMQKLQPELKELREKYKKDPKKLQEKQMLLYREHKINPLAGCLPIVIQIPVFISLFTILRSAVELRYERFLWIRDLSEPEGLLAGVIPFPESGLNILPLLMTGTMVLQQRMTPTAGDPQQQKVMAFLPVMMLFIFYGMPSALVLYWTVSQLLSILQLWYQRRGEHPAVKA